MLTRHTGTDAARATEVPAFGKTDYHIDHGFTTFIPSQSCNNPLVRSGPLVILKLTDACICSSLKLPNCHSGGCEPSEFWRTRKEVFKGMPLTGKLDSFRFQYKAT